MKRIWNKLKCLCGFHDNVEIQGDRIYYNGSYRIVGVTYRICKRCGKAYATTTEDADDGPEVA